jgi:3-phenylpropionate/trans-cinnamate dioxygenase ferredoxin subunit
MEFVKVARKEDIPPGKMKEVKIADESVLLVHSDGQFFAVQNPCTHMGCSLSEGAVRGRVIVCPCHGAMFRIDGDARTLPATKPLRAYELRLDGEDILVAISQS